MSFDASWYATVIETIADGLVVLNEKGVAVLANQRALDLLGVTLGQIRNEEPLPPTWAALDADGSPRPLDDLPVARALRTRQPVHDDLHGIVLEDGSVVWITVNVELVADGATGDLAAVATIRDTTEVQIGRNVDRTLLEMATRLVEQPVGDSSTIGAHLADVGTMTNAARVMFVAIEHESGRARVTYECSRAASAPRGATTRR